MNDAAARFRALHETGLFVMPNPWDAGAAKLLAGMGFEALATSSAALAWAIGAADASGAVTRDIAVAHAAAIAKASGLPVNGDFESGYGATAAEVAETIRRAIDAGVAGCSIEDVDQATGRLYPLETALRRLEAAVAAVARSNADFVLTGRTEVFFQDHPDRIGEAVRRLVAYEAAGVGAVYAPAVTTEAEIRAIVDAVSVPVNVLGGLGGISSDLAALERLGVRRVSIGSGLAKVALGAFLNAAEALAGGRFAYDGAATSSRLNDAMTRDAR